MFSALDVDFEVFFSMALSKKRLWYSLQELLRTTPYFILLF